MNVALGKYCLPEFAAAVTAISGSGALTAAKLDTVCTECARAFANIMEEYANRFGGSFNCKQHMLSRSVCIGCKTCGMLTLMVVRQRLISHIVPSSTV